MAQVRIEEVTKKFGNVTAVDHTSLTFGDGQLTVMVGPSGCGKTTLLRMIAGLEEMTAGSIQIGDRVVNEVPPWERNIAMVFQSYALYPHKTVADNLAFPLRARGVKKEERKRLVEQTARALDIADLLHRKPRELSGGQMQRVALGRAIVRKPEVFLMDEPLSNLDAKLRVEMRAELKRLQKELGVTTIYVTHDQAEAMTMGDCLVVMRHGQVQQVGEPEAVYLYPSNVFVAGFIGSPAMTCIPCEHNAAQGTLECPAFTCPVPKSYALSLQQHPRRTLILGIRPEDLSVGLEPGDGANPARVYVWEPMGKETLLTLDANGTRLKAITPPQVRLSIGDPVWMHFEDRAVRLFDADTEAAIPLP